MATNINTLKNWFKNASKPTQEQFWAWMESYYHKDEKISISQINNLNNILGNKADAYSLVHFLNKDGSNASPADVVALKVLIGDSFEINLEKNILSKADRSFSGTDAKNVIIQGFGVFPKLNPINESGQLFNTSSTYIAQGVNIFTDFIGNSSYRPNHPAHDSWVAFGKELGKGAVDGTNVTLVGTTLFHRNDIPYWDSVTAIGKGITNAVPPYNDPNRTATSKNGQDLRNMLDSVVTVGNEIWVGDIKSATVVGSGIKNIKYIFNSVIVGHQLQNMFPGEQEIIYDNDVIIGNGIHKHTERYPDSHNLIIGSTEGYGIGGWNDKYIPLIEGNFKDQYLDINGELSINIDKEKTNIASTIIPLSIEQENFTGGDNLSNTYDGDNYILTISEPGSYDIMMLSNLQAGHYLTTMEPQENWTSGTWGFNFGGNIDSDNGGEWKYTDTYRKVENDSLFKFSVSNVVTVPQNIKIKIKKIDENSKTKSELSIKDMNKFPIMEVRSGQKNSNSFNIGLNTGVHIVSSVNSTVIGSNTVLKPFSSTHSTVIGANSLKNIQRNASNTIVGANIGNEGELYLSSTAMGVNALLKSKYNQNFTVIGASALSSHNSLPNSTLNPNSQNNYDHDVVAIGFNSGVNAASATRTVFVGAMTGNTGMTDSSVFLGNKAEAFDTSESINEVVIGSSAKGHGNNTATIGNSDIQELWVGGAGAGIVLTSPDGTKQIKISIDNNGELELYNMIGVAEIQTTKNPT